MVGLLGHRMVIVLKHVEMEPSHDGDHVQGLGPIVVVKAARVMSHQVHHVTKVAAVVSVFLFPYMYTYLHTYIDTDRQTSRHTDRHITVNAINEFVKLF